MTTQLAEILVADPGAIELPNMQLFGVITGDINKPRSCSRYNFVTAGDPAKMVACSALWRGYVSSYRLRADGMLVLEKLEYPFTDNAAPDQVHEVLQGDFWLDLREWFMGEGFRVPFVDGVIQSDKALWRKKDGVSLPGARPKSV